LESSIVNVWTVPLPELEEDKVEEVVDDEEEVVEVTDEDED